MTDLYLLRHGPATPKEEPYSPKDAKRPLTPKGKIRTDESVRGMLALGVAPEVAIVSPYTRTQETAAIAVKGLSVPTQEINKDLIGVDPVPILAQLQKRKEKRILLVGHDSHLQELTAFLTGEAVFKIARAGMVHLRVEKMGPKGGTLVKYYTPKMLKAAGKA